QVSSSNDFKSMTSSYIVFQVYKHSTPINAYWVRVREDPPNGVMPTYSFSNILSPTMWHTNLNTYKDQAYSNITSIWSSDIYCDDNGNVFWTDTYGNVFVAWVNVNQKYEIYPLGTPYSRFAYAGPITSIAAVNYSTIAEIVVLTYSGYVFGCYPNNDTWFNATQQWNLPLTSYSPPWTSVTSNVEGYGYGYGYDEGFFFTDLNGNVYFYDTTNPGNSGWVLITTSNYDIISTVAYYNESYQNYYNNSLYGISYNGNVWVLNQSGWLLYNNTNYIGLNDLVGITMDSSGYLYLLQLNNKTTLYQSSTTAGSTTGTFSPYGSVVFSQGTNEAITYDQYNDIFWAIQTNGTIAGSLNPTKGWGYSNNLLYTYNYPTILAINSTYPINFNAYAYYLTSPDYTNMYNFTLYFTGSNGILDLEYAYQNGTAMNKAQIPALLDSSNGILINVTMMPNVSYNSHFYFYVIFYPQNNLNSVVLEYVLNIRIINHFSYIPIS
ncbi:MAG: hypothetical protein ACP5FQ_05865, partial [Thermoplasmata archaeon]